MKPISHHPIATVTHSWLMYGVAQDTSCTQPVLELFICTQPVLIPLMWRRILPNENLMFNYTPHVRLPNDHGYCIQAHLLLHGHETCNCWRSVSLETTSFYLPHDNTVHGSYPTACDILHGDLVAHFIEQRPWLVISCLLRKLETKPWPNIWIEYESNMKSIGEY